MWACYDEPLCTCGRGLKQIGLVPVEIIPCTMHCTFWVKWILNRPGNSSPQSQSIFIYFVSKNGPSQFGTILKSFPVLFCEESGIHLTHISLLYISRYLERIRMKLFSISCNIWRSWNVEFRSISHQGRVEPKVGYLGSLLYGLWLYESFLLYLSKIRMNCGKIM